MIGSVQSVFMIVSGEEYVGCKCLVKARKEEEGGEEGREGRRENDGREPVSVNIMVHGKN